MRNNNISVNFSRYISEFFHDYAPNHLTHSDCTLKSYKDALTLYIQFLESKGITPSAFTKNCFERKNIEEWIRWLKDKRNCTPATCNVRLASIRVFLEFVGSRDISLMYLYQEAKAVKRQKCARKKVNGLTRDAVNEMLAAPDPTTKAGKRDLVFMILLYATAARLNEILSIKLNQLHIYAKKPYVNIVGKRGKIRTLFLLPRAISHIEKYIQDVHEHSTDAGAYLFYSRVGAKCTKITEPAMDKRLKKYAIDANKRCSDVPLNIHAHQFRHAKASHWIEDGLNVLQVSFLLGHANLATTMDYLDISIEAKSQAIATLESETDKSVSKKWKNSDGSLATFCGLKR